MFEIATMIFQLVVSLLIILFIISFASFIYGIVKRQKREIEQNEVIINKLDQIIKLLGEKEGKQ